jgi:FkbM family methyltransferase
MIRRAILYAPGLAAALLIFYGCYLQYYAANHATVPATPKARHSHLSDSFMECMIDVGRHLPISTDGTLRAHHWDARRAEWNENIRFEEFRPSLTQRPLIVEIGGNTDARDSRVLRDRYPGALIHIFEPVPVFFAQLRNKWAGTPNVTLHMEGLGGSDSRLKLPVKSIAGESTFIMDVSADNATATYDLIVRDAAAALERLLKAHGRTMVDVLHVNCEGCEYEMFLNLASRRALTLCQHIQVSFHNYGSGGIGECMSKYCLVREALEMTHVRAAGVPFGWERWTIKP